MTNNKSNTLLIDKLFTKTGTTLFFVSCFLIGTCTHILTSVALAHLNPVEEVPVPSKCEASCCEPAAQVKWLPLTQL